MMSVSDYKYDLGQHRTEISYAAFKKGLESFQDNRPDNICNDLVDGKWSFEYRAYENAEMGCNKAVDTKKKMTKEVDPKKIEEKKEVKGKKGKK
jgi:hypothetical protein